MSRPTAPPPADDPLLTHAEAAELLRMTPAALHNARHRKDAPIAFLYGRRLLYRSSDIAAFIAAKIKDAA